MLPTVINILLVIHVIVSLLIILLVLMQRPKNEGLGAAFGGGATDQLFGAQTTNVLQTITRWLGGIFFALTLLLSILYVKKGGGRSTVQDKLTAPTVIPAPPAPPVLPPGAANSQLPATGEATPLPDGKKLELGTPLPDAAVSPAVKPEVPAPATPPAESKPADPAPAPEPPK